MPANRKLLVLVLLLLAVPIFAAPVMQTQFAAPKSDTQYVAGHIEGHFRIADGSLAVTMKWRVNPKDELYSPWIFIAHPDQKPIRQVRDPKSGALLPVGLDKHTGKYYGFVKYVKTIPDAVTDNGILYSARLYETVDKEK